jgi:hypothetical protein
MAAFILNSDNVNQTSRVSARERAQERRNIVVNVSCSFLDYVVQARLNASWQHWAASSSPRQEIGLISTHLISKNSKWLVIWNARFIVLFLSSVTSTGVYDILQVSCCFCLRNSPLLDLENTSSFPVIYQIRLSYRSKWVALQLNP